MVANDTPSSYIYVSQVWSDAKNGWKVADEMFLKVLLWAYALGKSSLRAETQRDMGGWYRRFGFEERSVVIEKVVTPEMSARFVSHAREIFNG